MPSPVALLQRRENRAVWCEEREGAYLLLWAWIPSACSMGEGVWGLFWEQAICAARGRAARCKNGGGRAGGRQGGEDQQRSTD